MFSTVSVALPNLFEPATLPVANSFFQSFMKIASIFGKTFYSSLRWKLFSSLRRNTRTIVTAKSAWSTGALPVYPSTVGASHYNCIVLLRSWMIIFCHAQNLKIDGKQKCMVLTPVVRSQINAIMPILVHNTEPVLVRTITMATPVAAKPDSQDQHVRKASWKLLWF